MAGLEVAQGQRSVGGERAEGGSRGFDWGQRGRCGREGVLVEDDLLGVRARADEDQVSPADDRVTDGEARHRGPERFYLTGDVPAETYPALR